jgi:hypothetical protein
MFINPQNGFAQILVLVLLLVGIGLGVFLVQNQTNFFPQAAELKEYLFAPHCEGDNQCKVGYICQAKTCDASKECSANPKGAMCAVKLRLCGGVCVMGKRAIATPSAQATYSASPSPNIASPSAKVSPSPSLVPTFSPTAAPSSCPSEIVDCSGLRPGCHYENATACSCGILKCSSL